MIRNIGKKGLELSVNVIVILIIGLTILGLVIGFVTTLIGDTEAQFAGQLDEDDQQRLDEVEREPGNFVVSPSQLSVRSGSNEPEMLYIKIRSYRGEVGSDCGVGSLVDECADFDIIVEDSRGSEFSVGHISDGEEFELSGPGFQVSEGAEEANAYELYVDGSVDPGTYYMRIDFGYEKEYSEVVTISVE